MNMDFDLEMPVTFFSFFSTPVPEEKNYIST
jgi:hypothetical protein